MRVLTMGTFDLLHPGHIALFAWCRKLAGGDEVIVTVNADAFVGSYKARAPVMGEDARRDVVAALADVDRCFVHEYGPDAGRTIDLALPAGGIVAIGADWRDRDYLGQLGVTQDWLDERGIVVVYVPLVPGHSSTGLREATA